MKSSSLRMIDGGIGDPSKYRDAVIHDWNLAPEYRKHLTLFKILETTAPALFFHLRDGELSVRGKSYSVIWLNSPQTIRESPRILVSLRYCKYLERGYALVMVLKGEEAIFDILDY